MSKFLKGLGEGVAGVSDTLLKDALEKRRTEGILRLQQQIADQQYGRLRTDQVADQQTEAARREKEQGALFEQQKYLQGEESAAADGRLGKTLNNAKEVARIGADRERAPQPQFDFVTREEPVLNKDGSPVFTTDSAGNSVPLTRKIPVAGNRFTGQISSQDGQDDKLEVSEDAYKRLYGAPDPAKTDFSTKLPTDGFLGGDGRFGNPPPSSGLLKKAVEASQSPAPIMRNGKVVQFAPPQPVYRNGKLVETR